MHKASGDVIPNWVGSSSYFNIFIDNIFTESSRSATLTLGFRRRSANGTRVPGGLGTSRRSLFEVISRNADTLRTVILLPRDVQLPLYRDGLIPRFYNVGSFDSTRREIWG